MERDFIIQDKKALLLIYKNENCSHIHTTHTLHLSSFNVKSILLNYFDIVKRYKAHISPNAQNDFDPFIDLKKLISIQKNSKPKTRSCLNLLQIFQYQFPL
ncbi:hypothetical protein TTHERM_00584940 (macronuclear) [Tetrahymena thermophila SB210]|uniref:Uncharacterized protein n=1 Tax=Tetrahymena thermophila (strain SB210) TaxID=312017 RepID=I7LZU5_TETTS|nr:hypothetical protein TTHERM_00584940 [Tetrahymena thermophila SB210]EAR84937.1 hypothetical protein TTHERM_00584940 [Tetrahymena thermophila SB210]|eukprot:XP_001032600.1 hypothetical protein TTHERM_00584940 [Tetrahymena thermophila SB210]